jgi:hypothetical protein
MGDDADRNISGAETKPKEIDVDDDPSPGSVDELGKMLASHPVLDNSVSDCSMASSMASAGDNELHANFKR